MRNNPHLSVLALKLSNIDFNAIKALCLFVDVERKGLVWLTKGMVRFINMLSVMLYALNSQNGSLDTHTYIHMNLNLRYIRW